MDRTQQQIAHRYGSLIRCMIAGCSSGELGSIKSTMAGQSHFEVGGTVYGMQTTANGIELRLGSWGQGEPDLVLRWPVLTRYVADLPATVKIAAREVDRLAHRPPHIDPANGPEGEWYAKVRQQTKEVLNAAFPLAVQDEPADLLELLAADV